MPLWRPWDDRATNGDAWRLVLPSGPSQAVAVAFGAGWRTEVPDHDLTSVADAAALVRAAAEVLRFSADPRAAAARASVAAAFDRYMTSTGLFVREGIWFRSVTSDYSGLFGAMLEAGFLLNPDPEGLGILAALSDGEWSAWRRAAEQWQEGKR